MKSTLIAVILLFLNTAFAAGEKNEDGSFKLSPKSLRTMGIKFHKLKDHGPWLIPSSSLVKIKFTQGVYRKIEEDITFVIVNVMKTEGASVLISSEDLEPMDEVAIEGVHFLRLTEADLNSSTVDSCAH